MNKIIDWIGIENEGLRRIAKISFLIPNGYLLYWYLILGKEKLFPDSDTEIALITFLVTMLLFSLGWFVSLLIIVRLSKWIAEGFKKG